MWEDFKFNPGQARGYTGFDGSQEKPYSIPHNKTKKACLPEIQRFSGKRRFSRWWKNVKNQLLWTKSSYTVLFHVLSYSSPSYTFLYIIQRALSQPVSSQRANFSAYLLSIPLWYKYPSIYIWLLPASPSAPSSCYASPGNPPKSSPALSSSSSSAPLPSSPLTLSTKCLPHKSQCRSPPSPPTNSLSLSLFLSLFLLPLLSNWAAQPLRKS